MVEFEAGEDLEAAKIAPAYMGIDTVIEGFVPVIAEEPASEVEVTAGWLTRQKTKIVVAAGAASLAMTVVDSPLSETKDRVVEAAKWMVPCMGVAEAAWIGGGAMMLTAIGSKIKNPLKIKEMVPQIADRANSSRLFRSGFWINTTAAVAEFGIVTAGVTTELPARSWGLAGFGLADLAVTVAVRRAIRKGIKSNVVHTDV